MLLDLLIFETGCSYVGMDNEDKPLYKISMNIEGQSVGNTIDSTVVLFR